MSQLPDTPRRFIAGAKCPKCQAVDKIQMYRRDELQWRECVSCRFLEQMNFEPVFRELNTRVNRSGEQKGADISLVRIIEGISRPKAE